MEAADFINKTLQRKPSNRLGLNGPAEVKNHLWLKDIDWLSITEKKYPAPFIPDVRPPLPAAKIERESHDVQLANKVMLKGEGF